MTDQSTARTNAAEAGVAPIVIDAGKVRNKLIRELKRGRGKLADEVHDALAEVYAKLGAEADAKEYVPVVVIYRRKRRRKGRRGIFPLLPFLE